MQSWCINVNTSMYVWVYNRMYEERSILLYWVWSINLKSCKSQISDMYISFKYESWIIPSPLLVCDKQLGDYKETGHKSGSNKNKIVYSIKVIS